MHGEIDPAPALPQLGHDITQARLVRRVELAIDDLAAGRRHGLAGATDPLILRAAADPGDPRPQLLREMQAQRPT